MKKTENMCSPCGKSITPKKSAEFSEEIAPKAKKVSESCQDCQ